jgi:hypothetical protein
MKTHLLMTTLVAALLAGINLADAGEAPGSRSDVAPKQEIRLERVMPEYWRITLDNPPFSIFGPETIPNRLTEGIELSDDRLPVIRSDVYVLAFARRAT